MIRKIISKIFSVVNIICCAMLSAQVVLVFITVICRNIFNFVPIWGESLTLFLLVWTSMIGASLPIRNDSHIRVTLVDKFLSKNVLFASNVFIDSICVIYCAVVCYTGVKMLGTVSSTIITGIGISRLYLYLSIPVAMILMILALAEKYIKDDSKKEEVK